MEVDYQKIIDFMLVSGKRLAKRAGNIADIGITKKDLTEEDITIERGFYEIIKTFGEEHILFSEEEHTAFKKSTNLWIVDPISATAAFIKGLPNYAIVASHLVNQKIVFAAIYNPSKDQLFTAYKGKGAFLNGKKISVSSGTETVMFFESKSWKEPVVVEKLREGFLSYKTTDDNDSSVAVTCALIARGSSDGVVVLARDPYPEFATGFIIREAGGVFTNLAGESELSPTDRVFVGGNPLMYEKLFSLVKKVFP